MTSVTPKTIIRLKNCQRIFAFSAIFSLFFALSGSVFASTQSEIGSISINPEKTLNNGRENSLNPIYKGTCDVDPKHPSC